MKDEPIAKQTITTTATPVVVHLPKWNAFLSSLASAGGNLFMLFLFSLILMSVSVYLMNRYGPGAPVVITLVGSFSTFTGALVGILRGREQGTAAPGMATSTTTSTIPPPNVPAVLVEEPPKKDI